MRFKAAPGNKVIGIKWSAYGSLLGVDSINLHSYGIWGAWAAAVDKEYQQLWAQTVSAFQFHASVCCLKKLENIFFHSYEQLQELFYLFAYFLFI